MASFHLPYGRLTKFQSSLPYFIILPQFLPTRALSALFIYSIYSILLYDCSILLKIKLGICLA